MSSIPTLGPGDAVIAVDVQKDFQPGGALAVDEGDRIVPVLNRWLDAARRAGAAIVASRDWHPPAHISFKERGGRWPAHCVQNTPGAAFDPAMQLSGDAWVISKGTDPDREQYSAMDRTGLIQRLKDRGVRRVWIGGLALDVCVRATARDALNAGFETHVLRNAARAVNPEDAEQVLDELRSAGAVIEEGADV